ncbi:hypothetical protein ACFVAE_01915 [Microbacterium sp. NPDC057659]|uniref:hypothetical protein n=1 Tax=Microbacterium sp. NPDC057659 TaxID=3346198 RepID=UPI003671D958
MAGRGKNDAQHARQQAERARRYAARTAWHEGRARRRTRDNIVASVVGGVIVVGAVFSQVMLAQAEAPAPKPKTTPTSTSTPAPTPTPTASQTPSE